MKLQYYICNNLVFHVKQGELLMTEFIFGAYNKTEPINALSKDRIYILKRWNYKLINPHRTLTHLIKPIGFILAFKNGMVVNYLNLTITN